MILAATVRFASLLTYCHYHPLHYRYGTDRHTNIQHRHHLFDLLHNQAAEGVLTFHKGTGQLLNMPAARKPPANDSESVVPMPPLHIQRRLTHSVDGISVWHHPACRATVQHHHADDRPPPEPPPDPHPTAPGKHHIAHWGDLGINLFTLFRTTDKLWVWCPPGDRIRDLDDLRCFGSIQDFELRCTVSAFLSLSPVQHLRLSLLFDEYGKCHMRYVHPPQSKHIFWGLQFQMKSALQAVNLGRWADLMQASIPYWPYTSLPALRVLRRKSHVGEWYVHVPPPAFLVYVCVNLRTGAVYVGQTSQAPIQRLRKHYCDARAGTHSASFHAQLLLTDISNWITIPVQYCDTLFQAGLAERQWWADLHKWALNDIPPGISETDTPNKQRFLWSVARCRTERGKW